MPPAASSGPLLRDARQQRHEADVAQLLRVDSLFRAPELEELLIAALGPDRQHHDPADPELRQQGLRQLRGGGRDNDPVEGRLGGPSLHAVTGDRGDVVDPETGEALLRLLEQRPVALDGVDPPRQPREHRRLIAGARADLEHLVARRHIECLGHQSDDLRLADGLALADGQRLVLVGLVVEGLGHKILARNALDGGEHGGIRDAAAPERHDQADLARGEAHAKASPRRRAMAPWVRSRCSGVMAMAPLLTAQRSVPLPTGLSLVKSPIQRNFRPVGPTAWATSMFAALRPWRTTSMPEMSPLVM